MGYFIVVWLVCLKMVHPQPMFLLFSIFFKWCEKLPSSIRHWDLNPRPWLQGSLFVMIKMSPKLVQNYTHFWCNHYIWQKYQKHNKKLCTQHVGFNIIYLCFKDHIFDNICQVLKPVDLLSPSKTQDMWPMALFEVNY